MSGPVLVLGPGGRELAEALLEQGHEVRRDGEPGQAGSLVTVAPEAELGLLAELPLDRWLSTFRAWAEEPFFTAQRYLQGAYRRGEGGSWIAVTSFLGAQPFPGAGAAGASALALHTLVRVAAIEGGPRGVRANAVAPGWRKGAVPRELDPELAVADTPVRRLATATDVAGAVAFLLSPAAAHITGEVIRVDGGYTLTRGSRPDPRKE